MDLESVGVEDRRDDLEVAPVDRRGDGDGLPLAGGRSSGAAAENDREPGVISQEAQEVLDRNRAFLDIDGLSEIVFIGLIFLLGGFTSLGGDGSAFRRLSFATGFFLPGSSFCRRDRIGER